MQHRQLVHSWAAGGLIYEKDVFELFEQRKPTSFLDWLRRKKSLQKCRTSVVVSCELRTFLQPQQTDAKEQTPTPFLYVCANLIQNRLKCRLWGVEEANESKKMKSLKWMAAMVAAVVMCFGFISCGGSDNDDAVTQAPTPTPTPSLTLVGTWKYNFGTQGGFIIRVLNADGTGTEREYDPEDGGWHKTTHQYTYRYDENQKRLYFVEGTKTEEYEVLEFTANKLVINRVGYSKGVETYIRQ